MRAYFSLFKQFILRALLRERGRTTITALGIALGVGVMIAIRLANLSALASFRAATESIAGETSVRITGAAGRFDEMLLKDLGWLREYGQISPVIEGYAMVGPPASAPQASEETSPEHADKPPAFPEGESLHVLGVDVLRDRPLRRYRLLRKGDREPTTREFLFLLTDPNAIILTEKFARRHNLAIGDKLALTFGDTRKELVISGLLLDEGPARALDGNFALMDIAAAQWAFNRTGLLDRVDVKLKPGLSLEDAEKELAARLPSALTVSRPEGALGAVEKMIAAFHFNLNALGSIALLVGLFLIYNTVSISVITRRSEIGALRAVGTSRPLVLALFLGEALLLALIGTVIGLGLGCVMASAAVRATATTVETFYIASAATESAAGHALGLTEIALAFAVALPLALVAALVPAIEAARVRPIEAMRGAERLAKSFRPSPKHIAVAIALFALGYWLSTLDAVDGLPVFGYLSALALMFGGAFLVPNALALICAAGGRLIARAVRRLQVEAKLASANLRGAIPRVSISVAALAVSLAMMVAISIMIESFRETVTYWVDQTLKADIYAKPVTRTTAMSEGEIDEEAIRQIKADPGVIAVDAFTSRQVNYAGYPVTLGAGDFHVLLKHGQLAYKAPANAHEAMRNAIGQDAVAISESFSLHFDKGPGDTVELPVQEGARPFKVAAVYYDYSNNRGAAVMDRRTFERYFMDTQPGSLSI
ncbi:MAG TPA: ABC transporter permease, partial [Blastocatellia bacterium]|nr:ABC transporter permease [Blastocatellia bacterium]